MRNDNKTPTYTLLVEEALARADDFLTAKQLVLCTGAMPNQVSAALYSLKKHHAADVVSSGEQLWWFSTPSTDTRAHKVELRRKEDKPRKARRSPKALYGAKLMGV